MIICENCNKQTKHFTSHSIPLPKQYCQVKRYWKCKECGTIYEEIFEPKHIHDHTDLKLVKIDKYSPRREIQTKLI